MKLVATEINQRAMIKNKAFSPSKLEYGMYILCFIQIKYIVSQA